VSDLDIWLIVVGGGILTYVTRIGGHLMIARIGALPPRLEAALNAVPAAVITTIVAPVVVAGTWAERLAILACAILALRLPLIVVVLLGTAFVAFARARGF
jgi:uncharacterized membrane protein